MPDAPTAPETAAEQGAQAVAAGGEADSGTLLLDALSPADRALMDAIGAGADAAEPEPQAPDDPTATQQEPEPEPADADDAPEATDDADPEAEPEAADDGEDAPEAEADDADDSDEADDPEAEAEADDAPEAEADDDDGADPEAEDDADELPRGLKRSHQRIRKLTAKVKEAERQLAALQERPAAVLAPTPDDPLANIASVADLDAHLQTAERTLQWCLDNHEGGEVPDGKGGTVEFEPAQVARIKARAEADLYRHGPRRRQWFEGYAGHLPAARAAYPELFEPGETSSEAEALVRQVPGLAASPEHVLMVGDLLAGRRARLEKAKAARAEAARAAARPKPRKVPAPDKADPSAAPPAPKGGDAPRARPAGQVSDRAARLQKLREKAERTGHPDDVQALFLAEQSAA